MGTKQMVAAVFGTVLKVVMAVVVLMFIYRGAAMAYDYGYRIFNEEPMSESPGVDVQVQITMGKSTLQIGQILEQKGLIRDAKLFYIQNLLSHYKDKLKPGEYVLNTSMTIEEMMEIMAAETQPETDMLSPDGGAGDAVNDNG